MSKVTERDVMMLDPVMLHNAIVRAECKAGREADAVMAALSEVVKVAYVMSMVCSCCCSTPGAGTCPKCVFLKELRRLEGLVR